MLELYVKVPITIIVKVRLHIMMSWKRHLLTQFRCSEKPEVDIPKLVHYIKAQLLLRCYRLIQRIYEHTIVYILTLQNNKIKGYYTQRFVDIKVGSGIYVYASRVINMLHFTYFVSS